ncbi:MFS transporter [Neobacillus cucumis]|uniref:MFS transporter n=1 Tax=Neobacillus cucumis TaxID=1740721 RepID=UPI002E1CD231|nr:MFS transporter [Neobacillus cucumis]
MKLWNIIIITFGFQTVVYLTRPVITLYALHMGSSTFEIGILTATYSFLPLIFAIHAGKIADKVGDRLPILLGSIGTAMGMIIPYLFASMWSLYVSQLIVGLSNVFLTVSLQNVLGNTATKANRDRYFSIFSMAVAGGALIGPLIGGYISEHLSYTAAFFISIFISFMPVAFSFTIPVVIKKKEQEKINILSSVGLLNISVLRKALFSSALVLYSKDIFIAYFPLFAKQYHISDSTIGWIISIQALAMMIVRFILPSLTNMFKRDTILCASIIFAGISFIMIPFTGSAILLGILSCIMGFGLGCGQPLSMTTTYNASPKNRTGEVLGLRLSTNRLSQLIAPIFFGLVGNWVGIISVFLISGAFLLGGTFFIRPEKDNPSASNNDYHA